MRTGWKNIVRALMGVALGVVWLTAAMRAQTPIGTRIDNRGIVRYRTADGVISDSVSSNVASVSVTGTFALRLDKTVAPATALPGDTVTYTIAARNVGSSRLDGVVVVDTLPAQLLPLSASHGIWSGNILRWIIGSLPGNGVDTVRISASVRAQIRAGSLITNSCFGTDTTSMRVVATADLTIGAAPRLDLRKSVSLVSVGDGDTVQYALRFSNTGNTTLSSFYLVDTLPTGVKFLSVSSGAQVVDSVVTFTEDSLSIGKSDSVVIAAVIRPYLAGGSVIKNIAYATTSQTGQQTSSAASVVRSQALVSFAKTASRDSVMVGDTVRFTLRFWNRGNVPLTNVAVADTLPVQFAFLSGPAGNQHTNGVSSFRRDSLARDESDSIVIVTRAVSVMYHSATVVNRADIISDQTPREYASASLIYLPVHSVPSVSFVKTGPTASYPGSIATYMITIGNQGPGALTGVVVIDTLDSRMKFVSASQNGVYDSASHRVSWTVPQVDSASTDSMSVVVALSDTLSRPTMLTNKAALTSDETTELGAQAQTFVQTLAKLTVWKVASVKCASPGDTLSYAITVENISATRADSVIVTDVLPEELEYISSQPQAEYTPSSSSCIWRLDSLSVGQQRQFRLKAIVRRTLSMGEETCTNIASLRWNGGQANSSLDTRSDASVTLLAPYLKVTKQAVRRIVEVGDLEVYTVSVTNLSATTTALQVDVIDNPPLGFRYVPGSSFRDSLKISDPIITPTSLQWHLADSLRPGGTIILTYRLVVGAGALDGNGTNRAQALALAPGSLRIQSSVASDHVEVRAGVFTDRGIIIGKVFYDDNEDRYQDEGEEGIKGVELMMEDGTRVVTGDDGKYSLPEVAPGEHVIRLRQETLPQGDELLVGYGEFANVSSSRFVNVTESGIARADFYVRRGKVPPVIFSQEVATMGSLRMKRFAEPRNLLFVRDESLAPIRIKGTQFEVGKATLRPEAYPTLKAVGDYAREFPNQMIAVSGHTDSMPIHTQEFPSNLELSEARAEAVRQYLIFQEHIDSLRITTIGFGESQPVATNETKSGRALNRRVEIMMTQGENPFENYFKTVRMTIAIDYEGAVPISRIELHDRIDTSFHFVKGSAFLGKRSVDPVVTENGLVWKIDSVGRVLHQHLTYKVDISFPTERSQSLTSSTSLTYTVGDSARRVNGACTTTNLVERMVRTKPVRFVMSGMLFDAGNATLKPEALNALTGAVDVMKTYPSATAVIDGFTDSRPIKTMEFASNVALSHARALAVLGRLVKDFGIEHSRLQANGWGELKPVASNATEEGRKANRRVEISIYKQETREDSLREGSVDSSNAVLQEVRDLGSAAMYDTSAEVSVGDHLSMRVSASSPTQNGFLPGCIADTMPEGLSLLPESIRLIRGIDSVRAEKGVLQLRCAVNDSVHTYSFMAEITKDRIGRKQLEHRVSISRTQKNGRMVIDRSTPFAIPLKNEENHR